MKKKIKIFVSSNAYKTESLKELIDFANKTCINLEISGGLTYTKNTKSQLVKISNNVEVIFHNYFPIPINPFVVNLGSPNKEVLSKSLNHCKKSISLSTELNLSHYSFHTPFCVDPHYLKLSKSFPSNKIFDRDLILNIFINSLTKLAHFKNNIVKSNVNLLFENNVCSNVHNMPLNKLSKLFTCTGSDDFNYIFNNKFIKNNYSILVDFAHLNISSKVLKFNKDSFLSDLMPYITGAHLSESSDLIDNNKKINSQSWFLKKLPYLKNLKYVSLEVFNLELDEIKDQVLLLKKWI